MSKMNEAFLERSDDWDARQSLGYVFCPECGQKVEVYRDVPIRCCDREYPRELCLSIIISRKWGK